MSVFHITLRSKHETEENQANQTVQYSLIRTDPSINIITLNS